MKKSELKHLIKECIQDCILKEGGTATPFDKVEETEEANKILNKIGLKVDMFNRFRNVLEYGNTIWVETDSEESGTPMLRPDTAVKNRYFVSVEDDGSVRTYEYRHNISTVPVKNA